MRLLGDLLFDSKHLLQYIDVLLEGAGDLLVLLQLLREENLDVSECFKLGIFVFSYLVSRLLAALARIL